MVSASLETDQLCVQPINYIYKVQPQGQNKQTNKKPYSKAQLSSPVRHHAVSPLETRGSS